jgi:hypothetical protein
VVFTTQLILDNYCILYLLITLTRWQPFTTQCPMAFAQLFMARGSGNGRPWNCPRAPAKQLASCRHAIGFLPIGKRRSPTPKLYKPFPFLPVHHSDLNCGPINNLNSLARVIVSFLQIANHYIFGD